MTISARELIVGVFRYYLQTTLPSSYRILRYTSFILPFCYLSHAAAHHLPPKYQTVVSTATPHVEQKAGWKNEVEVKTYDLADVKKHNAAKDLWIAIHGNVYDLTTYVRDHPGGVEPLLEVAGSDATSAYEDVGHSEDAGEIMQAYLVGVLRGGSENAVHATNATENTAVKVLRRNVARQGDEASGSSSKNQNIVYGLVAGGLVSLLGVSKLLYDSNIQLGSFLSGNGSFYQGAMLTFTLCGSAGLVGALYLQKATAFGAEFHAFPAHVQSSFPRISEFHPGGVLTPSDYSSYRLRQKEELAPGIFKFVFDLPAKYAVLGLPIGQHVAIRATIGDHTIVRSYTPISNNRDLGLLELLVRVYPDGKLGNFLKQLSVGESASIRGPKGTMRYRRGMSKAIGMVGGGTGITPLFQVIRAVCEDEKDTTKITLIYGNRSESDIMLREKLDHYAKSKPQNLRIHYTLDQPSPGWTYGKGHVTKELLQQYMPKSNEDSKVFLCGPPGMVNATKKNLIDLGFESPGAVSKVTDQIFCF